jgi:hypothetical protein
VIGPLDPVQILRQNPSEAGKRVFHAQEAVYSKADHSSSEGGEAAVRKSFSVEKRPTRTLPLFQNVIRR